MKRVMIRNVLILVVILFLSYVLVCGSNFYFSKFKNQVANDVNTVTPIENKLSLVMVGDGLIHGAVYSDAYQNGKYNFYSMLSEMKPIISSYDLAFYNQESILGGK